MREIAARNKDILWAKVFNLNLRFLEIQYLYLVTVEQLMINRYIHTTGSREKRLIMQVYANEELNLEIFPLDINRWKDFETLFGDRGACGGCWCMSWRLKRSVFENQKGDGNKRAMRKLVEQNERVGLLTYINNIPIGWCAVAPREDYLKLENSRIWKRIDNELVWSITCFFVAKPYRRKGLSLELLKGVIKYGEANKVIIIEGYPIVPYNEKIPAAFQCDRVIGSIALNNIVRGSFQSCHLGYKMDQININKGYMTEGLEKVIDYAF